MEINCVATSRMATGLHVLWRVCALWTLERVKIEHASWPMSHIVGARVSLPPSQGAFRILGREGSQSFAQTCKVVCFALLPKPLRVWSPSAPLCLFVSVCPRAHVASARPRFSSAIGNTPLFVHKRWLHFVVRLTNSCGGN